MIAKQIVSPKGGVGYLRLAGYVLNVEPKHKLADPASWTRLNAYILDQGHQGAKVAWARATNCQTDDPGWAVREILATQARNTRSRSDKGYHLVASFPDGEQPTREQIEDIEDRLCIALSFEEHQRVSAVHQNTENWHVHIAINKVHPRTFRNIEPFRDYYRLQEVCAELEIRHGLMREPHTIEPEKGRGCNTNVRGRAADFEAQQGSSSFLRWVREQATAALLTARDSGTGWQELHSVAAHYDLEIKPHGVGLVIGHRSDSRLHIKASDADRGLSMQALTGALGRYERPGPAAKPAQHSYTWPVCRGSLYEAFKQERDAAVAARKAALKKLHEQHLAYAHRLKMYYRERFRQERLIGLHGFLKRDAFQHIAHHQTQDRAERARREAEERRALRAQHPIPIWQNYLENAVANGDETALSALRGRMQRRVQLEAQLLQAENAGEARHIVYRHLRPEIRRDGRVIYRVTDGGVVSDEARHVRVKEVTTGATTLALSLAADRFGHRPLNVRGTAEFRKQVAILAGIEDFNVAFADIALEQQRMSARRNRENVVKHNPNGPHTVYERPDSNSEQDRDR